MVQISIETLHSKGVIFVVNIENMFPWKNDIQISRVPICAIAFRIRGCIYIFWIVLEVLSRLTTWPVICCGSRVTIVIM